MKHAMAVATMRFKSWWSTSVIEACKVGILLRTSLVMVVMASHATPAHSDFRKALEAYQNRDGKTMLAEVSDAMEKKNDDGLMLFLMAMQIDVSTSAKKNLYESYPLEEKDKGLPSIRKMLTESEFRGLLTSLVIASNYSQDDVQHLLIPMLRKYGEIKQLSLLKATELLAESGSSIAISNMLAKYSSTDSVESRSKYDYWRTKYAEAGNADAQELLGFKYLNATNDYGCKSSSSEPICSEKDENKGYYWLKKAAKTYESSGHDDIGPYASRMCEFFRNAANGNEKILHQAYLWCLLGVNTPNTESITLLNWMHQRGELKIASPMLDSVWDDQKKRDSLLYRSSLEEIPDFVIEARKQLSTEDVPVFTYYENDFIGYEIDVYLDGRVNVGFGNEFKKEYFNVKSLWLKLPSKTIEKFISDLKKTGLESWPIASGPSQGYGCTDNFDNHNGCALRKFQITLRDGAKSRKKYLLEFQRSPISSQSASLLRISKIHMLVEKNFKIQNFLCHQGDSVEYKKACLLRNNQLMALAKEGK